MSTTEQVPTYPDLVRGLADRGLVDGRWRRVFEAVPRSRFVPARVWR
ncbi:methyltransferase, partial [Streptomyces cyaneofuscatus]